MPEPDKIYKQTLTIWTTKPIREEGSLPFEERLRDLAGLLSENEAAITRWDEQELSIHQVREDEEVDDALAQLGLEE